LEHNATNPVKHTRSTCFRAGAEVVAPNTQRINKHKIKDERTAAAQASGFIGGDSQIQTVNTKLTRRIDRSTQLHQKGMLVCSL
jgi:nucleoside 2-deoxyribosyltransferase